MMIDIWKHVNTGKYYQILNRVATLESDLTPVVVYQALVGGDNSYEESGKVWVRPESEFFDGRFVQLGQLRV